MLIGLDLADHPAMPAARLLTRALADAGLRHRPQAAGTAVAFTAGATTDAGVIRLRAGSCLTGALVLEHGRPLRKGGLDEAHELATSPFCLADEGQDIRLLLGRPWPEPAVLLVDAWSLAPFSPRDRAAWWDHLASEDHDATLRWIGPSLRGLPVEARVARRDAWAAFGAAVGVIGHPGALAWDAQRLDLPVHTPPWPDADPYRADALACLLPAAFVRKPEVWRMLLPLLADRERRSLPPLLHPAAVRAWDVHHLREPARQTPLWKRRLTKLLRDPKGFWRDSWFNPGKVLRRGRGEVAEAAAPAAEKPSSSGSQRLRTGQATNGQGSGGSQRVKSQTSGSQRLRSR